MSIGKHSRPKRQSIIRQARGIPLISPQIKAKGMTRIQEIIPILITPEYRIGSWTGNVKKRDITICPKANQSVPYPIKE